MAADGDVANLMVMKEYIKQNHNQAVSWHLTLNNTMSTRPKDHGGPVVRSVTDAKTFAPPGSSSANPLWQCTLRLPHSFAAGDQRELVVVGSGTTQKEADEDACCASMAGLLLRDPGKVVLRPVHWQLSPTALLAGVAVITNQRGDGVVHQPLAVRTNQSGQVGLAMSPEEKKNAIEGLLRECLKAHGGSFDPSHISRRLLKHSPHEKPPWKELEELLQPGELRGFVEDHAAFRWRHRADGKGMIIEWAHSSDWLGSNEPGSASSGHGQVDEHANVQSGSDGVVVREVGGKKILLKCKQSNEPGSASLGHGQGDEHANVQSDSASSGDGQEHQFAMFQRGSPISRLAGESFQ